MKVFPNKLPSRIKQYTQSLIIFPALESTKTHSVEFCLPYAVSSPIKVMVVLFLDDMMRCFAFQKGVVGARVKVKKIHPQLRNNWYIWKLILNNFSGLKSSVKELIEEQLKIIDSFQEKKDWIRERLHLVYKAEALPFRLIFFSTFYIFPDLSERKQFDIPNSKSQKHSMFSCCHRAIFTIRRMEVQ